jgi:hypothetical protein
MGLISVQGHPETNRSAGEAPLPMKGDQNNG